MQVTRIVVTRKKNLGNYETADLSLEAQVDEGDNVEQVTEDLAFYVDFKLNEPEREAKVLEIREELSSGIFGPSVRSHGKPLTEEAIKKRQEWLDKYNSSTERFNNLEFIK